jgi:PHD/YefM family antitoxin component YafN of YafNO toxin-antitoxin module
LEAIYPITALQKGNAKIKAEARERMVHVTENGHAAFVFMSEEVLDEIIAREREDAVLEAQMIASIDRGLKDFEEGRYYEVDSVDELMETIRARRAHLNPDVA